MENLNQRVKEIMLELYADFNGNSSKVERYLDKRIALFEELKMDSAKALYEAVKSAFDINEYQHNQIVEANRRNEEEVAKQGRWH
jgi:hypothetical protein